MGKCSSSGLMNVIAGQSAICAVGDLHDGLFYRGHDINTLAQHACFEEVAYLLIHGQLPDKNQLQAYQYHLAMGRTLPEALKMVLIQIGPNVAPMDVLRTGCSMLGCLFPESLISNAIESADRALAMFPAILLFWYMHHHGTRRFEPDLIASSTAEYLLRQWHGSDIKDEWIKALDVSLILYAEHEFNASTFAARVCASTGSDIYSAWCAAIGTLKGALHGGANEQALALIQQFETPEEAASLVLSMLRDRKKIMGFGHRVYQQGDPRSPIIQAYAKSLSTNHEDGFLYDISTQIESVVVKEKSVYPNLDFYTASAYHFCGIPRSWFTPIFVLSRLTGWTAHIIEQRDNNKIIRPISEYVGPKKQEFIPLDQRHCLDDC